MLIEIAKKENRIPDYVTIDYLIYLGVRLFPEVEIDLKKSEEITSKNRHELAKRMNKAFDKNDCARRKRTATPFQARAPGAF